MSSAVRLYMGSKKIDLKSFDLSFSRKTSPKLKIKSEATAATVSMSYVPVGDEDFILEWMLADRKDDDSLNHHQSSYRLKDFEVVFYENSYDGPVLYKFKLNDSVCIDFHEQFDIASGMRTKIVLTSAIFEFRDVPAYVKSWNESWEPPSEEVYTPLPVAEPEEKNPKIVDYYLTDLNGNRIEKAKVGDKVYLNIETKDLIGELLTISLNDKNADYKYKGEILPNDKISDYKINSDFEKIKLEVVPQQGN